MSPPMTAPSVSLLPCPFCNGPADFECIGAGEYTTWSVGCANSAVDCIGFQMMARFSRKCEAAEAWNTRATPPAPTPSAARERIARIMDLVEALQQADCEFEQAIPGKDQPAYENLKAARAELERALEAALLPDAAAIYVCYDGYGQYFISRERPASHVAIVYDEDAAEKVVDLFNDEKPDAAAIRAAAFEEAAKIAASDALHDQWPLHGSEMQAPSRRMQIAIAAAIRAAGEK